MADMTVRNRIKTQLNEKVSQTQIDILYPETLAKYIITDSNNLFVTEAEKEQWNSAVSTLTKGLLYFGKYSATVTYPMNAVVEQGGKFFISLANNNIAHTPVESVAYNDYWANINMEAYKADNAELVKVTSSTSVVDQYLTFVETTATGYKAVGVGSIKYNPSSNTLYVGNITVDGTVTANKFVGSLEGKADNATLADKATVAEKYVEYNYADDGTRLDATGNTPDISYAITDLINRLSNIEGGGATLKNSLTINKIVGVDAGGNNIVETKVYNGSTAVSVDIKQYYKTAEITDLLDSNSKIKDSWLPDSILGQLEYGGVFDPSVAGTSDKAKKGYYYIATTHGTYNPDGTTAANAYDTGDWAVYNGASWDKVDNTDAVTMVNSQIGQVETYKGDWVAGKQYYRGDIVKNDSKLYICSATHVASTAFSTTNWELFGRSYTGDEIITVSGDTITHKKFEEMGETTSQTLQSGESFNVPVITRDTYGHVSKIDIKQIQLGTDFVDTTRPIAVNSVNKLSGTGADRSKALNIVNGSLTTVTYENDQLSVNHNATGNGAYDLIPISNADNDILYPGNSFKVPGIKIDAYGHIIGDEWKEFTLAEASVKHNHFNIVKDSDGAQVIGAYTGINTTAALTGIGNLKFYQGTANPTSTEVMKFNGNFVATKLYNGANATIDSSAKLYSGLGFDSATGLFNKALIGSFDTANNRFEIADSGVTAGVYSAISVNSKGIVTAGGQIVEFGQTVGADPSDSLAVGGLFFRLLATE